MTQVPSSIGIVFLITALGVQLNAETWEGYWQYSEESIEQITDYTLEARKTGKIPGDSSAAEIAEAYRNHLRLFSIQNGNRVQIRLIQFDRNDDPYPEYYRDFLLDYVSEDNHFTFKNGETLVFSGTVENDMLFLKDGTSGRILKMIPVPTEDMPTMSDGNFKQIQLDRQPRAKKLVTPEYPAYLEQQGIGGIVQLSFYVNKDGSTSEVKVLSSPHSGLERVAIDAILESTFHPGRVDRKPVRTHVKLPISFR